jgi:hypothetical protein
MATLNVSGTEQSNLLITHSSRLLIYWWHDRSPARLGRGDRQGGSHFGCPPQVWVWLSHGMRPAGHRGGEWLKRGLTSSK